MEVITLKPNGMKMSMPLTVGITIALSLIMFGWGAYAWLSSQYVSYKEFYEIKEMIKDIKINVTNIKVTLKMKGLELETVE